jgi:hypothetical protein
MNESYFILQTGETMKTLLARLVLISPLVLAYVGDALAVLPNLSAKNAPPNASVSDPRDAVKARASSQTQGIPADTAKRKPNSGQPSTSTGENASAPGRGDNKRR